MPNPKPILDSEEILRRADETNKFFKNVDASHLVLASHGFGSSTRMPPIKFDGATERNATYHTTEQVKDRIAACREAYENSGIIGNAIDLMVDFALEDFDIVHHNPAIQNFYQSWADMVGLKEIASQILKCYYRDGNVPILRFRGRIKANELDRFQRAVAQKAKGAPYNLFIDPGEIKSKFIPYAYHVLDILSLNRDGSELLGNVRYKYQIPAEDLNPIKNQDSASPETTKAIDILRQAIGDEDFRILKETGFLRMDPNRLTLLSYKKDDYRVWANPMFWRVIEDVRFKKLLRDMDVSVCESVINTIVIVALGNTVEGFPATSEMITKFADLMKVPTKSKNFIWNDLIKIMSEYPPVDKILGEAKYKQVDTDIRAGLGISEVVLNGQGNNYANSFLSVKTLMERLESGRTCLLTWLDGEIGDIAKAMGFKQPAWFKMHHMSLRDEEAEKRLLLDLVDRGMLSYETCVDRFGENFAIEVERMQREDDYRRKNERKYPYTLVKTGKFGPNIANGPLPVLEMLDTASVDQLTQKKPNQTPTQQGGQGPKGGRPTGTGKPQKKTQTPRNPPLGQKTAASINEDNISVANSIFDNIYKKMPFSNMSEESKKRAFSMIAKIIDGFNSSKDVTSNKLQQLIKSDRSSVVFNTYEELINRYIEEHSSYPSYEDLKKIIVHSFAVSLGNK